MTSHSPFPSQGLPTGPAKLKAVTELIDSLTQDLEKVDLNSDKRDAALEELKLHGRDPRNADPIFTKDGIKTLTRHAFESSSPTTSRNALKVLANAMVLNPAARQYFVDFGCEAKACDKLSKGNWEDEFLLSRIIFLTTYGTSVKLPDLIEEHHLAEGVVKNLEKHAKLGDDNSGKAVADPMEGMALSETAKLLFNVSHFCFDKRDAFNGAIPHIATLLCELEFLPTKALEAPFGQLVNALLNLDLASKDAAPSLFPDDDPNVVVARLIKLLELASTQYQDGELEQIVTPLIGILGRIYEAAPAPVRKYYKGSLLPTEDDRQQVLGQSKTLSSWLLRSMTNPVTPQLRDAVSHLLFDLSDKDANTFVENVGYGFASGFLFQNNIPVPEKAAEAAGKDGKPVNPVTGQFLNAEKIADMPEMTVEEKEREAERLFVLFERLKKNGLISAENPVETAMREGRLADIDDKDRIKELD